MKLIQILCKRTCGALIAGRRSAAPAAPGAAPATKASRGNTREDGPSAHPLRLWERGLNEPRCCAASTGKNQSHCRLSVLKQKSWRFMLNSSCSLHYQSTNLSFSPPFLETSSYQMSMNALTLIESVLTNQELKEKVEFWPTVGGNSEMTYVLNCHLVLQSEGLGSGVHHQNVSSDILSCVLSSALLPFSMEFFHEEFGF